MKVLLLCPKAFETMEFSVFIDVLGWARESFGNDIHVHTCGFGKHVISTFNVSVQMDVLIDEVDVNDYDALAIPGGFREFGFKEEAFHSKTQALIRAFHEQEKSIATVCVAAFALAESGILKGKRATVYHLDNGKTQQELAEYGVNVIVFDTMEVAYLMNYSGFTIPNSVDKNGVEHSYKTNGRAKKLTITVSTVYNQ